MITKPTGTTRAALTVSLDDPDCYSSINAAIAVARDGDTVSVLPGTYPHPIELDRAVTISAAGFPGEVRVEVHGTVAIRASRSGARLTGIHITGAGGDAVVDVAAGVLELDECVIAAATEVAVVVRTGAELRMRSSGLTNSKGAGVLALDGGVVSADSVDLGPVATTAFALRGASTGRLEECTMHDASSGLLATGGAEVTLRGGRAERIGRTAITAEAGGSVTVADFTVADCAGVGSLVAGASRLTMTDSTVRAVGAQSFIVMGEGRATIERVEVNAVDGYVLHLVERSRTDVTALRAVDVRHDVVVVGDDARLEMHGTEISECRGAGVQASDDADVRLVDCLVSGSATSGALARDRASLMIEGGHVHGCRDGVAWMDQARGSLVGTRVDGNQELDVDVADTADVGITETVSDPSARTRRDTTTPPTAKKRRSTDGEDELDTLLAELEALVGLEEVKRQVETLVRMHQMTERRAALGLPSPPVSRHLVFAGAPGTGKTTVARLYGRILASLGVLRSGQLVEVARPDLVAAVIGGTAIKTTEMFERALGGVLFIDEAYALAKGESGGNDFGSEAIDTLVKLMEDHRDDVVVIVAGYTSDMRTFLAMNPGLSSRFSRTIEFADYSSAEMVTIVENQCRTNQYSLEFETRAALHAYFTQLPRDASFGNGRTARGVFEEMLGRQAYRLADDDDADSLTLTRLRPEDIGPLPGSSVGAGGGRVDEEQVEQLLTTLRNLVGLEEVKDEVAGVVDLLTSARRRQAAGLPMPSLSRHLIFAGPPGTGKTTVARLYGSLLTALGVLPQGQVTEVSRADLVGEYIGHTARRTTEAFDRARGGVMFIDEAYTLAAGGAGGNDFGKEAIDTLVKLMEDHRDEVVVIAAGYEHEMSEFLAMNPGLDSRFSHRVQFANYTPDELVTIVNQHATGSGYECTGPAVAALRAHFSAVDRGASFGNGRYARQVMDAAIANHARRTRSIETPTADDLVLLLPDDIPGVSTIGARGGH